MKVYIVRHGETESNLNRIHQSDSAKLTKRGLEEAKLLSERVAGFKVDKILTSPILRAINTAEVISEMSKVSFEVNDLLKELKKPSEIEGKSHSESVAIEIKETLRENYHQADWHYSDEESFLDFKKRILILSEQLLKSKYESTLIVTHSAVIKMFVSLAIYGDSLTSEIFLPIYDHLSITNTGITYCTYELEKGWKVNCFNDVNHLSEYTTT